MALKIVGISIVVGFVILVGLFAYFRKDLPNINDLSGNIGGTVTYYDRTDQTVLFQDSEAVKRIPVSGDDISQLMKDATIAIEDKDFYKHGAFDLRSIVRAGVNDVFNRSGGIQGGSTISQQLVKLNQDWTNDRTIARKVKELILAVELEREYSKDEILNGYLNVAPYGGVLYGVESAARDYFGTTAKDLTLAQASLLAGMPKSPTFYSPYNALADQESREALIGRQHYILDQMVDQGMIAREQADEAQGVDVLAQIKPKQTKYQNIRAPYFVLAAKNELETKYGSETVNVSGWKVTTTLDLNLQDIAEREVREGLGTVKSQLRRGAVSEKRGSPDQIASEANIAFAAMDVETAQMVALVGGVDFNNTGFGELNYASYPTRLPPGSSYKPYDYMAMMENTTNTGAGSVLYDIKAPIPGYAGTCPLTPAQISRGGNCAPGTEPFLYDYDSTFPGPVTLRYSLAGSRNIPAVKAMLSVVPGNTTASINKTIDLSESMGLRSGYKCFTDEALKTETQCYASSAIGDGAYLYLDEHVNGFATMSRLGLYRDKTYILKIVDDKNKVVDEWKQQPGEQVLRPDTAFIAADMLSDPRASYMSRKAQDYNGWRFALKTGTTNDNKDGWMMGTSAKYAAGVWVGHAHRQVAFSGFMETMTLPIWQGWMNEAHKGQQPKNWEKPSGVQTLPAFVVRSRVGARSSEQLPSPDKDLFPSWYQQPKNNTGGSQSIDKVSEKLATSCTPDLAKETRTGGNDSNFSADIFVGTGAGANLNDQDDVHNCNDAKPSITLTTPSTCSDETDCVFIVTVSQGTHPLSSDRFPGTVSLTVNGQALASQNVSTSPSTVTFTYPPTADGTATIEASVIDSVLYSSTQSATVTFEVP